MAVALLDSILNQTLKLARISGDLVVPGTNAMMRRLLDKPKPGPLTTFALLEHAEELCNELIITYLDAKRSAEFFGWKQKHIERIDVVKRATAKIRADMLEDAANAELQEELVFG